MAGFVEYQCSVGEGVQVYVRKVLLHSFGCRSRGEAVLSYMGHIGMCRCEGYGFQAVYSSIGFINQSVLV